MHQATITMDELAQLEVHLELRDKCDLGGVLSITGRHPDVGAMIGVQDGTRVFLLSERPLAFSRVPDSYRLEAAIAEITNARSNLEAAQVGEESGCQPAATAQDSMPRAVRGMLTWLGIDPVTASRREIAYAREAAAHAREMVVLPPAELAQLRDALLDDLKKLAA